MNTGVKVARNGGMDFFGNPVSSGGKPTPGAHELNGTASGESEMIDKLNDWSNAFYYSPNLNLDRVIRNSLVVMDPELYGQLQMMELYCITFRI